MAKMTEQQLVEQEKIDQAMYGSNKSLFETLVLQAAELLKAGHDASDKIAVIIEEYNNRADSSMRLMQKLRRLENEKE